mgnify:CR=1 FL=1
MAGTVLFRPAAKVSAHELQGMQTIRHEMHWRCAYGTFTSIDIYHRNIVPTLTLLLKCDQTAQRAWALLQSRTAVARGLSDFFQNSPETTPVLEWREKAEQEGSVAEGFSVTKSPCLPVLAPGMWGTALETCGSFVRRPGPSPHLKRQAW